MCKAGKLIGAEHQLCLAHGVHLAAQGVLYKHPSVTSATMENLQSTETYAE